jgi:hypothetical protein
VTALQVYLDIDLTPQPSGVFAYYYPNQLVTDPTDGITLSTQPQTVVFNGTEQSPLLYATDNPNMSPPGWAYTLSFSQNPLVPGAPAPLTSCQVPAGPLTYTATDGTPCVVTPAYSSAFTSAFPAGLPNGTGVEFTSGTPAGFTVNTTYYVVNSTASTVELAATRGGSPIASSGTGSGNLQVTRYAYSGLVNQAPLAAVTPYLTAASNLAGLANPAVAQENLGLGTIAAYPYYEFQQTLVPVFLSAGTVYSASINDLACANCTTGNTTVNLPFAPENGSVVGVKITQLSGTYTAAVNTSGSDVFNIAGGVTSLTLKLLDQGVYVLYKSGIWSVIGDDLPLSQLDLRYGQASFTGSFSPMNYGAAGNGVTNDDTPVHSCFSAAAAAGGIVDLGTYTFLTSTPIPLLTGTYLYGSGMGGGGALINNTSDLFSITGTVSSFTIKDCSLTASAGHVFNCASGSTVAFGKILGCAITQTAAAKSIWYMPSGTYIDMLVGDSCVLSASGSASAVPWYIVGLANSNRWRSLRVSFNGASATKSFFWIECDSTSAWSSGNTFRDITAEQCVAGIINGLTVSYMTVDSVCSYDVTTYNDSLFSFGAGTGSLRSETVTVRNCGRAGGTLGSGAYDVYCAPATQAILIENVGPETGSGSGAYGAYSLQGAYATVINGVDLFGYVQSGSLTAFGIASTDPAPSRLVGGSTVSGAPTAGAWNALDVYTDASGVLWICTVGGTPGTWVPATAYAGVPMAAASQGYAGWTSDPLGGTLLGTPILTTWTAGVLYARRIDVVPNISVNGYVTFQWLNHALMSNSYFSLWSLSGTTITLIGSTADISANATGWNRIAVSGFTSTPANGVLYVTYMNGTSGVAGGPFTERGAWSQAVPTTSAQLPPGNTGQYRWMQGGSGLTSPSSASPFSLSGANIGILPFWCALD